MISSRPVSPRVPTRMPEPAIPLTEKVVLVTGAARRVGAVIADAFHAQGARVAVHYRSSRAEAESLVARLEARRPGSARAFAADLTDTDACGLLSAAVPRMTPTTLSTAGLVIVGESASAMAAGDVSTAFAKPKSSTFTDPSGRTLMFAGLRSRCTMP